MCRHRWSVLVVASALAACASRNPSLHYDETTTGNPLAMSDGFSRWMAAREEFDRLKEAYLEFCETPEVFTTKPFHSTEGRAILAMGKRALPFIVEEIRNGKTSWKWAAFFIIPPLPPPHRATWEETAEAHNAQL